ncbi:MAG: DUF4129 domain-containing protein [Micromonosporaceae bacterium]
MARLPRAVVLLLVGLLFAGVAAAVVIAEPRLTPAPPVQGDNPPPSPPTEPTPGQQSPPVSAAAEPPLESQGGSGWGIWVLGGLIVLAAAGAVVVLWRRLGGMVTLRTLRDEDADGAGEQLREQDRQQVRQAVRDSLDTLDAHRGDPRSVVIGCWLRLEQAATAAGVRRSAADTPGDLITRMLAGHELSQHALDQLAAAYRQARYAPHEIGDEVRDLAREALRQAHQELSGMSVGGPPPREPENVSPYRRDQAQSPGDGQSSPRDGLGSSRDEQVGADEPR